jgi:integrase
MSNGNEGSTPALEDEQARRLLEAPAPDTLKGVGARAILAILLYHGIRREELCKLCVGDIQTREGVKHFRVGSIAMHPPPSVSTPITMCFIEVKIKRGRRTPISSSSKLFAVAFSDLFAATRKIDNAHTYR